MSRMESLKVLDLLDYTSGTADRNGTGVDMQGLEWCIFIVKLAAVAASAVTSLKLQESTDNGVGDAFADLEGSAMTIAADDDNQTFAIAIYRPRERYVRPVIDKDTANAVAEVMLAVAGGGGGPNLADVTDELTVKKLYSPAQGTP